MSSAPFVALISPSGFFGNSLLPFFVDAVKDGRFSGLKLVTTNASKLAGDYGSASISVHQVDYSDRSTLDAALKGAEIVVSAMSVTDPSHSGSAQNLIEAAAAVGVKTYFPSEWGYDYDDFQVQGTFFEGKGAHRVTAEKLGLKTVAFCVGAFIEVFLNTPAFGKDGNTLNMLGDGNKPYALTGIKDIARYLVRAIEVVHKEPQSIGRHIRVLSVLKTPNEYADIIEKVTGESIKRVYLSQQELRELWDAGKESPYFPLRLFAAAADFSSGDDTELLNPGHKYFEPVKFEDYLSAPSKA